MGSQVGGVGVSEEDGGLQGLWWKLGNDLGLEAGVGGRRSPQLQAEENQGTSVPGG